MNYLRWWRKSELYEEKDLLCSFAKCSAKSQVFAKYGNVFHMIFDSDIC